MFGSTEVIGVLGRIGKVGPMRYDPRNGQARGKLGNPARSGQIKEPRQLRAKHDM